MSTEAQLKITPKEALKHHNTIIEDLKKLTLIEPDNELDDPFEPSFLNPIDAEGDQDGVIGLLYNDDNVQVDLYQTDDAFQYIIWKDEYHLAELVYSKEFEFIDIIKD